MARRLSAKEKNELAALQKKKNLTKADRERMAFLTAGSPCASCSDVTPTLALDDLADKDIGDTKATSEGDLGKVFSGKE